MTVSAEPLLYAPAPAEPDTLAEERAHQLNWQFDGEPIPPPRPRQKMATPDDAQPPRENRAKTAPTPPTSPSTP